MYGREHEQEGKELNTTETIERFPRRIQEEVRPNHVTVTTANTYDIMEEEGEDDVAFIVPASGYRAAFKDGSTRALAVWCVTEGGNMFGVALTPDGKPPITISNVENEENFSHYLHKEDG